MADEPKIAPNRGNAGKGRPKGVPNKQTAALKDMILGALDKAGGERYLLKQANENPSAFMQLIGKVLPTTLAGTPGAPIVHVIELVDLEGPSSTPS